MAKQIPSILAISVLLGASLAHAQVPGGSYTQTCTNAQVTGNILHARCRTISGQMLDTSLNLPCAGAIDNINGVLKCTAAATPVPPGSYLQSCGNVRVQNNMLLASCRRIDQTVAAASLALPCSGGIDNLNGVLTCKPVPPAPPPPPTPTFKIVAAPPSYGTIQQQGLGPLVCGQMGMTCSYPVPLGKVLQLKATPAVGYAFASWGGDCSGQAGTCKGTAWPAVPGGGCMDQSATCTVTMSADRSVSATFKWIGIATLTLNVGMYGGVEVVGMNSPACGGGVGGKTCSIPATQGTRVTLLAVAGHAFASWSGACSGSVLTCTVVMDSNKMVGATFK